MKNKKILVLIIVILLIVITISVLVILNITKKDEIVTVSEEKKMKTYEDSTIGYTLKYNEDWKQEIKDSIFTLSKEDYKVTLEQLDYTTTEGIIKSTDEETIREYSASYKADAIEDDWKYISDSYTVKGNLIIFECDLEDLKDLNKKYKVIIFIEKEKDKMLSFEYSADSKEVYDKYMQDFIEIKDSLEFK